MKPVSLLIPIIIIVFVFIILLYIRKNKEKKLIAEIQGQINFDDMMNEIRKVSFENQMESDAEMILALSEDGEVTHKKDHFLPAGESGWLPYFVPGVIHITFNNKTVDVDISDRRKEYKVIIKADGSVITSTHDVQDDKYSLRITDDGHFAGDSAENLEELQKTFSFEHYIGIDKYDFNWFARLDDGYEVWGVLQGESIVNGGVHASPRIINFDQNGDLEVKWKLYPSKSDAFDLFQAFCITYLFLEKLWEKTENTSLAWILSGSAFTYDGFSIDRRFQVNFRECAESLLENKEVENEFCLDSKNAFRIMYDFLKMKYPDDNDKEECGGLLAFFDYDFGCPKDQQLNDEWFECCNLVAKGAVSEKHFLFKLHRME